MGVVVFLAIHQRLLVLTIVLHGCVCVPGYPPETISSHHSTPWVWWCSWLSTRVWGTITFTIVLHGWYGGIPGYPPETGNISVLTIVFHGCGGVPDFPPETGNLSFLTIVFHGCGGVPGYPPETGELLLSP
jgi:hypothetical protein